MQRLETFRPLLWRLPPATQWWLVGGLLIAEYLSISIRFDARHLLSNEGLGAWLGWMGNLGPLAVAVGTAIWLFDVDALRERMAQAASAARPLGLQWGRVAAHLSIFTGLWLVTRHVFEMAGPQGEPSVGWLVAWLGLAVATLFSALRIALPAQSARFGIRSAAFSAVMASVTLGGLAWVAGHASLALWPFLSHATLRLVEPLLWPWVEAVAIDPELRIIGTPTFAVQIAPICSGLEGIGLISVFLTGYLWRARRSLRFPHALALLPAGILAVWFGNGLRIAMLIAIGSWGAEDIAYGGFHSKAGWLLFCGIALGLVGLGRTIPTLQRQPLPPAARAATPNPTTAHLVPLLAVLATGLVTGLVTVHLDYLYPLRIAAAGAALTYFWRRGAYASLHWHWSWAPPVLGLMGYLAWRLLTGSATASDLAAQQALFALPAPLWMGWLALRGVGSVVVAPVVEELAFRGYLMRRLVHPDFAGVTATQLRPLALIVSSFAFGALHQAWLAGALVGLLYALAWCRRGRLSDAIVAHAVTNALLGVEMLLTWNWWSWL